MNDEYITSKSMSSKGPSLFSLRNPYTLLLVVLIAVVGVLYYRVQQAPQGNIYEQGVPVPARNDIDVYQEEGESNNEVMAKIIATKYPNLPEDTTMTSYQKGTVAQIEREGNNYTIKLRTEEGSLIDISYPIDILQEATYIDESLATQPSDALSALEQIAPDTPIQIDEQIMPARPYPDNIINLTIRIN